MRRTNVSPGDRYGSVKVVCEVERRTPGKRRFRVLCDCGSIRDLDFSCMNGGHTRTCVCTAWVPGMTSWEYLQRTIKTFTIIPGANWKDYPCVVWPGALSHGYGAATLNGKSKRVHVVSFEELFGKIPQLTEVDHLCRNRACFQPGHLEAVCHMENMRRSPIVGVVVAQLMSSKTHCPKGHSYSEDNTIVWNGKRSCRTCKRQNQRNSRAIAATVRKNRTVEKL